MKPRITNLVALNVKGIVFMVQLTNDINVSEFKPRDVFELIAAKKAKIIGRRNTSAEFTKGYWCDVNGKYLPTSQFDNPKGRWMASIKHMLTVYSSNIQMWELNITKWFGDLSKLPPVTFKSDSSLSFKPIPNAAEVKTGHIPERIKPPKKENDIKVITFPLELGYKVSINGEIFVRESSIAPVIIKEPETLGVILMADGTEYKLIK